MKTLVASLLLALSFTAQAEGVRLSNLGNWLYQDLKPGSPEAEFASANGLLTLEPAENSLTSVYLVKIEQAVPKDLSKDPRTWHKFMFSGPQTQQTRILSEQVKTIDGSLRYLIDYQTANGTNLKSTMMVTVVNNQAIAFLYEMNEPLFSKRVSDVHHLLQTLHIEAK